MQQYFNEVRSLVLKNTPCYLFAKHFASYFPTGSKIAIKDVKKDKHGNPISCTTSFGKLNCCLCMKELLKIQLINSNNKLYRACRHKPKFHSYTIKSSTDG